MRVIKIILGIFGALVALFAGGCALFFLVAEPTGGMLWVASLFGILPAGLGGLLAWWAFRRPADDGEGRKASGISAGRMAIALLGGVVAVAGAVALLVLWFGSLYPDGPELTLLNVALPVLLPVLVGGSVAWRVLKGGRKRDGP